MSGSFAQALATPLPTEDEQEYDTLDEVDRQSASTKSTKTTENTQENEEGSIVLIDPKSGAVVGTLLPNAPEATVDGLPRQTDVDTSSTIHGNSTTTSSIIPTEPSPSRQGRYSYTYRLSLSDVSLRTVKVATDTAHAHGDGNGQGDGPGRRVASNGSQLTATHNTPPEPTPTLPGHRMRSSWMTDDASFWTARGTLRSEMILDRDGDGAVESATSETSEMERGGRGSGEDREVILAYVRSGSPVSRFFP